MVKIDLAETALEQKIFEPLSRGDSDADFDWIVCKIEARQFVGYGGANNLSQLLRTFLNWAES